MPLRRRHANHVRTFLEILSEVAGAALSEAESAAAETDEDKYRRLSVAARAAVMRRHRVLNLMTHVDPAQRHDADHDAVLH